MQTGDLASVVSTVASMGPPRRSWVAERWQEQAEPEVARVAEAQRAGDRLCCGHVDPSAQQMFSVDRVKRSILQFQYYSNSDGGHAMKTLSLKLPPRFECQTR